MIEAGLYLLLWALLTGALVVLTPWGLLACALVAALAVFFGVVVIDSDWDFS